MSKFTEVAKTEELKSGTMKKVSAEGQEILLARVGDRYYATDDRCPHMKGDLSQGKLHGTVVTCPVHGSQLDISTGQVVRWLKGGLMSKLGSAFKMSRTITVYNVKVENGKVLVEFLCAAPRGQLYFSWAGEASPWEKNRVDPFPGGIKWTRTLAQSLRSTRYLSNSTPSLNNF